MGDTHRASALAYRHPSLLPSSRQGHAALDAGAVRTFHCLPVRTSWSTMVNVRSAGMNIRVLCWMTSVKQPIDFSHSRRAGGKSRSSSRRLPFTCTQMRRVASIPGTDTPSLLRAPAIISAGGRAIVISTPKDRMTFSTPLGEMMRPRIQLPWASETRQTRRSSSGSVEFALLDQRLDLLEAATTCYDPIFTLLARDGQADQILDDPLGKDAGLEFFVGDRIAPLADVGRRDRQPGSGNENDRWLLCHDHQAASRNLPASPFPPANSSWFQSLKGCGSQTVANSLPARP